MDFSKVVVSSRKSSSRGVFFDRHELTRPIRYDGVIGPNDSHKFRFLPAGGKP
jgi:hypothetical protein